MTVAGSGQKSWKISRLQHFYGHFTSYLPTGLIAGMAAMLAVDRHTIFDFLVFTVATISLEVCFTCLRAKYRIRNYVERKVAQAADPIQRRNHFEKLQTARIHCGKCWCFVGTVIISWVLVATCEVAQMGKLALGTHSKLVAALLSGVTFAVAVWKMWDHATTLADEDYPNADGQLADGDQKTALAPKG